MRRSKQCLLVCTMLALSTSGISGCANIQNDGTRTRTEGTLLGAGAGAGAGAGIGAAIGGGRGAALGAGIGVLVGALSGFLVGNHIANQKAQYASDEEWLEACINQAQQRNDEAAQYNEHLRKDIAALDKQSTQLAKDYKAKKASRAALNAKAEDIEKRRSEIAANIAILQEEIKHQKSVVRDARENRRDAEARAVEVEIAGLEKKIVQMREYNRTLGSMAQRVSAV